ncbi:MAG: ABC transporter permease [Bacteroidales bacterium]|jgi:ABC-type antimicrobial peptide transport system permease subunit|nr:ABC transporter permease [Bacteroidales bacterium]
MIGHLLKLLWNKKCSYYGIFIEQALVSIILMFCMVSLTDAVKKYHSPGLLDTDNTLLIGYMFHRRGGTPDVYKDAAQSMTVIIDNLRKLPFVEFISNSNNLIPYMKSSDSYSTSMGDSITVDGKRFKTVIKISDEFGGSAFKVDMEEGHWLENRPMEDGTVPTVITRQFADKVGWDVSVGKKITATFRTFTVVGVVSGLKEQAFDPSPVALVVPSYLFGGIGMFDVYSENVARIKPGKQSDFYDAFDNEFKRLMPSDKDVESLLYDIQGPKGIFMSEPILNLIVQGLPTFFLFLFAFIGTFGLYWLYSRKRQQEFALRIALGSTPKQLTYFVLFESLLVTAFAILPALLLSVFIYEYTTVHIIAVSITVAIMLLFSIISAWYPAWKVSRVNPAEALQYE